MTSDQLQENGKVFLQGVLRCSSGEEMELVKRHLDEHVRLTREEDGCISFEVFQMGDPLIWQVQECFETEAAFVNHQNRTRASSWWEATKTIARDYEITGLKPD